MPVPVQLAERIADVLDSRSGEIVERLVDTYRHNPGYDALDRATLERDLLPVATANERLLIQRLRGLAHDSQDVAVIAQSAVRRFGQGVPQAEVMRAYRLWSMAIWTEITEIAGSLDDVDTGDLVGLAAVVLEHNEYAGGLAADVYDAEQHGIWVGASPLRGTVLERFLSGTATPEELEQLRSDFFSTRPAGVEPTVMLVGPREGVGTPSEQNEAVRAVVADWKRTCVDETVIGVDGRTAVLVGIVPEPDDWQPRLTLSQQGCVVMAIEPRAAGLADAFARCEELREILAVAQLMPPRPSPLRWQDTLLGSLVRAAPVAIQRRLLECHGRLTAYEENHATPLLETVDVYLDSELSVARTAQRLFCHPNTIRYRLQRVKLLSGLDPAIEGDRLILRLATTLAALEQPEPPELDDRPKFAGDE